MTAGYHALERLALDHELFAQVEGAYTARIPELMDLGEEDPQEAYDTGKLWGEALEGFQNNGWGY